MLRSGLIGAGIQASRSPSMHMTEARALGLDLVADLFDLDKIPGGAEALPKVLAHVHALGGTYLGVNVTLPVKQTILALLDSCSDDARALGACNTVVFRDGRSTGHNTDWIGFAENLRRGMRGASLDNVVLLGAGGAGSAATYALLKMGARRIAVYELDRSRTEAFVARFQYACRQRACVRGGSIGQRIGGGERAGQLHADRNEKMSRHAGGSGTVAPGALGRSDVVYAFRSAPNCCGSPPPKVAGPWKVAAWR